MRNPSSREPNSDAPLNDIPTEQKNTQPAQSQANQRQVTPHKANPSSKRKTAVSFRGKKTRLNKKQANLIIGGVILTLVVLLVFAALLPSCRQQSDSSMSSNASPSSSLTLVSESGYDKDKNLLNKETYGTTILGESKDAGETYVEETLFLGDSNTARMLSYYDVTNVTLKNGIGVEGMGVQAVSSLKCVQFKGISNIVTMPEAVAIMQPKRIVITFGTNNAGGMSAGNFAAMYKEAVDSVHKAYPSADIIIGAVPPIDRYHMNEAITMTTIDQFNLALVELAEKEGYKFLNWTEALKDPGSGFCKSEYTIQDGIHLSRSGMQAIFNYMRTHSYITEDTRPKLKPVPERIGYNPGLITQDPDKIIGAAGQQPSSSYSSSSTTPQVNTVTVAFGTMDMGTGGGGGGSVSMGNTVVSVGTACPAVTATPAPGYEFSHWESTLGGLGNSPTLSGFIIPADRAQDEVIYITAFFRPIAVPSVPVSVIPPSPPSEEAPAPAPSTEELPPAETPPAETPAPTGGEETATA